MKLYLCLSLLAINFGVQAMLGDNGPSRKVLKEAMPLVVTGVKRFMSQNKETVVQVGGLYQHYKGKDYRVLDIARCSENPEKQLVIYQALYTTPEFGDGTVWARPLEMFTQKVVVEDKQVDRFTFKPQNKKNSQIDPRQDVW